MIAVEKKVFRAEWILYLLLILLFLGDTIYTFFQFYWLPLDGDMASLILPDPFHQEVLKDPFGFRAFFYHEKYYGPNRFFVVWIFSNYFKSIPLLLQNFFDPIASVYISVALAKIIVYLLLLLVLSKYSTGAGKTFSPQTLIAAVVIMPLIQVNGFYVTVGVIDQAITYVFFYALPITLLLFTFLPFCSKHFLKKPVQFTPGKKILLVLSGIVLSFTGPLISPIILLVSPLALFALWYEELRDSQRRNFFRKSLYAVGRIHRFTLIYFLFLILLSLYSLYVGTFNSENSGEIFPLGKRYEKIPLGLQWITTYNVGLPALLSFVIYNTIIIGSQPKSEQRRKTLNLLKYILIFVALYIVLLPLGGYRFYRPNIIRYDTFIPVTLAFVIYFGFSSTFIIHTAGRQMKAFYLPVLVAFLIWFTIEDKPFTNANRCEKRALQLMAESKEKVIEVSADCHVMDWTEITNPDNSLYKAQLIHYWGITDEVRLYFQKK